MPEATTADRDTSSSTDTGQTATSDQSTGGTGASSAGGAPVANTAFARALEDGGYFIDIGPGITISPEDMSATVDLSDRPQILPGVNLRSLRYNARRRRATVRGDVDIPHIRSPRNGISISIGEDGNPTFDATLTSDLPIFKNKRLQVSLNEQKQLAATLTIEASDLEPRRRIRNLEVDGSGTFTLNDGRLSGNMEADLTYDKLGSGHLSFSFNGEGAASGSGNFNFEQDYLRGASASLEIDENANLKAEATIPVSDIQTPVPGLSVTEGSITFGMDNSTPSGNLTGVKLAYNGIAEGVINARIRSGKFSGRADLAVTLPELADATGRAQFEDGVLTGSFSIQSRHFPDALRVQSGSITLTLTQSGDLDYSGEAVIDLGPVGTGQLRASKENDVTTIGATVNLQNITGLQNADFSVMFNSEGKIEGEGDIAIDDSLLPGLSGALHLEYKDNLWAGETEIGYTREDPSVNGNVTVRIRQTEEGTLAFSGEGEVNAEVIPGVEGTVGIVVDEESNITLNIAFTQTDPWELFPERRVENEFLNVSRNIPLWAGIVVAVIRIRAGTRAGVGPGQIRNSRVEGTWLLTGDQPPDLSVSTEFFMPAFVEGYVAFGAGLGLDVVLGSLTGGIEGVATAGLYGAVSVVPELSYENGEWLFDGTATLAAGARLKLSLNAWAEIEALWVTVWERTWELASHTMNIGPDLVLRANVSMNLSNPSVPELTFESSDVDNEGLIDSAMPEDGPPSAGAREALGNRAEWSGRTRQQGQDADSVPPELASQANQTEQAPQAPGSPSGGGGGGGNADANAGANSGANSTGAGTQGQAGGTQQNTAANASNTSAGGNTNPQAQQQAQQQAGQAPTGTEQSLPPDQAVDTDQPRYPNTITLQTLDEPPATLPRTAAQKREDLDAALACVRAAAAAAPSTEALSEYFPRIRQRFQLTTIGFESAGRGRLQIVCTINPRGTHDPAEDVQGSGITEGGVLWQSEIRWRTAQLGGVTVGAEMEAVKLGPDHPQGGPPGSGQDALMDKLVTQGAAANSKYIRGHLLNDNLGGSGENKNLYPITAHANNLHASRVENPIKNLVNDQRYWVYYKVSVKQNSVKLNSSNIADNKVNSEFNCEAYVLRTDGRKSRKIKAKITSQYQKDATAPDAINLNTNANSAQTLSGPDVLLSSRSSDTTATINGALFNNLKRARQRWSATGWIKIDRALLNVSGIGSTHLSTLHTAYANALANDNDDQASQLTPAQRSSLTRVNNLAADVIRELNAIS